MKRATKITTFIIIFFLIIAAIITGRYVTKQHFQKKFGKRPPPAVIVTTVKNKSFHQKIETYGTALPNKTTSFRIKKTELLEPIEFNREVKKGDIIGHSGTTGYDDPHDQHIALGTSILTKNLVGKEKKKCEKLKRWKCYVAPERYFKWENLPTDSDAYLLPIMSKKYLKEIGYKK